MSYEYDNVRESERHGESIENEFGSGWRHNTTFLVTIIRYLSSALISLNTVSGWHRECGGIYHMGPLVQPMCGKENIEEKKVDFLHHDQKPTKSITYKYYHKNYQIEI